jgi:hypothetical protein
LWGKATTHEAVLLLESERSKEKERGVWWEKKRVRVKVCTPWHDDSWGKGGWCAGG